MEERKKITLMLHSELGNTERKDLFHILDQNIDFSNKIQVYYALLNFKSDVFCRNLKAPSLLLECWVWGLLTVPLIPQRTPSLML